MVLGAMVMWFVLCHHHCCHCYCHATVTIAITIIVITVTVTATVTVTLNITITITSLSPSHHRHRHHHITVTKPSPSPSRHRHHYVTITTMSLTITTTIVMVPLSSVLQDGTQMPPSQEPSWCSLLSDTAPRVPAIPVLTRVPAWPLDSGLSCPLPATPCMEGKRSLRSVTHFCA